MPLLFHVVAVGCYCQSWRPAAVPAVRRWLTGFVAVVLYLRFSYCFVVVAVVVVSHVFLVVVVVVVVVVVDGFTAVAVDNVVATAMYL